MYVGVNTLTTLPPPSHGQAVVEWLFDGGANVTLACSRARGHCVLVRACREALSMSLLGLAQGGDGLPTSELHTYALLHVVEHLTATQNCTGVAALLTHVGLLQLLLQLQRNSGAWAAWADPTLPAVLAASLPQLSLFPTPHGTAHPRRACWFPTCPPKPQTHTATG